MIYNIWYDFECFRCYLFAFRRSISYSFFILGLFNFAFIGAYRTHFIQTVETVYGIDSHHNLSGVQFIVSDVLLRFIIFVSLSSLLICMCARVCANVNPSKCFIRFCFLYRHFSIHSSLWNMINIYQFIMISLENFTSGASNRENLMFFFFISISMEEACKMATIRMIWNVYNM